MEPIRTETDLDRLFTSARLMAVINAWAVQGLFEKLAGAESKTLEALPGDRRALRVTGRILANAGLLMRRGDQWALSAAGKKLYDEGLFGDSRTLPIFRELSQLPALLTDGGPVVDDEGQKQSSQIGAYPDDPERTRSFMEMLYRRSATSAGQTAQWIDRSIDPGAAVLDLGGGHGRYGKELAERGHDVTLFDLPICVDVARKIHGDELDYIEGDFFDDSLGGPYDVVLASNIIHGLSENENRRLIKRVTEVLKPGGIFVMKDMFLDEFGLWPPGAVHFGLLMLMYTDGGDSYSLKTVYQWFEEVELEALEPVIFEGFSLVTGKKQ